MTTLVALPLVVGFISRLIETVSPEAAAQLRHSAESYATRSRYLRGRTGHIVTLPVRVLFRVGELAYALVSAALLGAIGVAVVFVAFSGVAYVLWLLFGDTGIMLAVAAAVVLRLIAMWRSNRSRSHSRTTNPH